MSKRTDTPACAAVFFRVLGRRVKELRIKAGYTQAGMVTFEFSMRHWQQIEHGRPISLNTLLRIAEIFKIKPEDLVRGLGPAQPQTTTTDLETPISTALTIV